MRIIPIPMLLLLWTYSAAAVVTTHAWQHRPTLLRPLAPVRVSASVPSPSSRSLRTSAAFVGSTVVSAPAPASASAPAPSLSFPRFSATALRFSSDWDDFAYDDPDGDDDADCTDYAEENDTQERKAEVGGSLDAPEVDWFGEPIEVPQGSTLALDPETIQGLLAACRLEIGTMFGYSAENRGVGITGGVDYVDLDGPIVVLRLKGRFWHQRPTVLERVGAYLIGRCPEIIDVVVEDEWQLTDEANNVAL